ncbi:hypothetical protein DFH06DRAFT_733072 [Mycena polygramma]|nr:hypothetical protein DFH06DRAFT_733072 [Mycena polygramma]
MLKQLQRSPEDLIRCWEEILFLTVFNSVCFQASWNPGEIPEVPHLSQTSPQLIRIIHAYQLLRVQPVHLFSLFEIRLVLDCSWDDLRAAICPLQEMFQEDEAALKRFCATVMNPARMRELCPDTTLGKIAEGCMRLVNSDIHQLAHKHGPPVGWSFILRLCPPSSELLNWLRQSSRSKIISRWRRIKDYPRIELYNITQWLETFPDRPVDVITQFKYDPLDKNDSLNEEYPLDEDAKNRILYAWDEWKEEAGWW